MIVYGSSLSPFVRKVLAFAHEKGIVVESDARSAAVGRQSDAFLEASPLRKIPALRDGDFTLADSSAIIHYLEAKQPEPALIPAHAEARGRTIWFEEYADTVLVACGAKMFFNRLVAPVFLRRPGDSDVADKAEREDLPPILAYLERVVPDAGGFLVGETLTLADIAIASPFANFGLIGCHIDPEAYPRTLAYSASILSRPSFAALLESERALLERARAAA